MYVSPRPNTYRIQSVAAKPPLTPASLGRPARVSVMVQAAVAEAGNILILLSVEAVGQMQFSTAMVQQPVPARQNSFLGKLRWMPRLVGGARQAATRTNPWGMLLCADSPRSLLVAGLKSAPSGRDIVTVFQPPYSQPLVASLSTRQRFRTSKVPHGCGL